MVASNGLDWTVKKKDYNKIRQSHRATEPGYENEKRISRTAGENRCSGRICINEAKPKVNVARNDLPRIVGMLCGVICSRALLLFIGTPARRAMEINSMLHGAYSVFLLCLSFFFCP